MSKQALRIALTVTLLAFGGCPSDDDAGSADGGARGDARIAPTGGLASFSGTIGAIDEDHGIVRTLDGDYSIESGTFATVDRRIQTEDLARFSSSGQHFVSGSGTQILYFDLVAGGEPEPWLTDPEQGGGAYAQIQVPMVDDSGDVVVYSKPSPSSKPFVKRRGDMQRAIMNVTKASPIAIAADGMRALVGGRGTNGVSYVDGDLTLVDTTTLERTPFWFEDVSGAPLAAAVARLSVRPDLGSIVVRIDSGRNRAVKVYDVAARTLTDTCGGMLAHYATLPGAGAPSIELGAYRGDYASVYLNDASTSETYFGAKMAYVCNVRTGETFAVGIAPGDIVARIEGTTGMQYQSDMPRPGELMSGPGFQYFGIVPSSDGAYAAFTALWTTGLTGSTTGKFTVLVPRASFVEVSAD